MATISPKRKMLDTRVTVVLGTLAVIGVIYWGMRRATFGYNRVACGAQDGKVCRCYDMNKIWKPTAICVGVSLLIIVLLPSVTAWLANATSRNDTYAYQ